MQILWIIFSYFLGAVSFGLVISKKFCNIDPRTAGSNNVGATNVARLCGTKFGILTLACDILKGTIPVLIAISWDDSTWFVTCTGLAAVLGHVFSCFLGFKGGKAVATSIGVFLPIALGPLVIAVVLCLGSIWYSGFVSVGSLVLVASMPIILLCFGKLSLLPLALSIACLVIWKHWGNIQRLMARTEKSWKKSEYKE